MLFFMKLIEGFFSETAPWLESYFPAFYSDIHVLREMEMAYLLESR